MKRILLLVSAFVLMIALATALATLTGCSDKKTDETETTLSEESDTVGETDTTKLQNDSAETYLSGGPNGPVQTVYEYITVYQQVEVPVNQSQEIVTQPQQQNNDTQSGGQQLSYQSLGNGTCKLIGAGSCNDACIVIPERSPSGETVVAIGDKAFYGNSSVSAIQLPSTVSSIGELALASCTNLAYISVSPTSQYFKTSGNALYTKDGKTLVVYPSANNSQSCTIPAGVTAISEMAFYNCKSLKYVSFGGTQAEWASIRIGAYNYSLSSAAVYCSDNGK